MRCQYFCMIFCEWFVATTTPKHSHKEPDFSQISQITNGVICSWEPHLIANSIGFLYWFLVIAVIEISVFEPISETLFEPNADKSDYSKRAECKILWRWLKTKWNCIITVYIQRVIYWVCIQSTQKIAWNKEKFGRLNVTFWHTMQKVAHLLN